jgi:hypothetical protein
MPVENNKKLFRFEISFEDGKIAMLEYRWKKGDMLLMRTYVPVEVEAWAQRWPKPPWNMHAKTT